MASRVFVSFSSTDIHYYRLLTAWKAKQDDDFNFIDCQLHSAINSDNETYIKRLCRERINMAGTLILLIGKDTKSKHKYVKWEIEVALEKECRIICINLNKNRAIDDLCPSILKDKGAMFIPYNKSIIQYALDNFVKKDSGNWSYKESFYKKLKIEND